MSVRISPTTTGYAHIGHLLLALVNEAHRENGEFYLRFEDYLLHHRTTYGAAKIEEFKDSYRSMLEWAGIEYIEHSSRDLLPIAEKYPSCSLKPYLDNYAALLGSHSFLGCRNNAEFYLGVDYLKFHSYTPYITWNRVIWDNYFDVDPVIRGIDLASESSLYLFFASILEFRFPHLAYIPHLQLLGSGGQRQKLSKSQNLLPYQITEIMRKASFADTLAVLKCCCLKEADGGFRMDNLKPEFVLHRDFMEIETL